MWIQMPHISGVPPPPRNCHSLALVGQRIFVVGGFTEPPDPPCLTLAAFDLDAPGWQHPTVCVSNRMGVFPAMRYAHSAIPINEAFLVVFGGYGTGQWLNDLWFVDIRPGQSDLPTAAASADVSAPVASPARASGPASAASSLRYAPPQNSHSGSGWPYSVMWHSTSPGGVLPPPRAAHTAVLCEGCMVVFGGNDGSGLYNDAWMISVSPVTLPVSLVCSFIYLPSCLLYSSTKCCLSGMRCLKLGRLHLRVQGIAVYCISAKCLCSVAARAGVGTALTTCTVGTSIPPANALCGYDRHLLALRRHPGRVTRRLWWASGCLFLVVVMREGR